MILEQRCAIPAPASDVWPLLLDLERVAPCLPGGEVTERVDDRTFKATMHVRVGPLSMKYNGTIAIGEVDEAALRTVMDATAKEARGQGTAEARITTTLTENGDTTHADVVTDLAMTGRAASMGRGIIGDVADRMMQQFAANLAQEVLAGRADGAPAAAADEAGRAAPAPTAAAPAPPAAPKPINGFRLMLSVLLGRLRHLFGASR